MSEETPISGTAMCVCGDSSYYHEAGNGRCTRFGCWCVDFMRPIIMSGIL